MTGAFLLLGGLVFSAVFTLFALRRERPSEIAFFLGLIRRALPLVIGGTVVVLVLGLWLVDDRGYSYSSFWVIASVVLVLVASIAGKKGGEREDGTRELALKLAAEGDAPSAELRAQLRDRTALALSWGAGLALLVVLGLMIWKPGS